MSEPNNFNPFTEPYHPVQIPILTAIVVAALPGTFCFGFLDRWNSFKGVCLAIKDIPASVKDTWKEYYPRSE